MTTWEILHLAVLLLATIVFTVCKKDAQSIDADGQHIGRRTQEEIVMAQQNTFWEEFRVTGGQLVDKVQELIHEGNVRRLHVKQDGKTVLGVPLTIAAVGVVVAPVLAGLGAFAALVTDCSIAVEREAEPPVPPEE